MERVRCTDCGFLGLRHMEFGELNEVDESFRQSGNQRAVPGKGVVVMTPPVCAKDLLPFPSDTRQFLDVMNAERTCDGFMKRRTGCSPKDHRQIEMDQFIREETARRERELRDWQAEQRKLDLERQQKQRAEDLDRQERQRGEDLGRQGRQRRSDRVWAVVLLIIGATVATLFEPVKAWVNYKLGVPPAATANPSPK